MAAARHAAPTRREEPRSAPRGAATRAVLAALLLVALLAPARVARADAQTFASPQEAAKALIEASRANDEAALRRLVGDEYAGFVLESDDPAVGERRRRFAEGADARLALREDAPDVVTLVVGLDAYVFPIPLVRGERGWYLDAASGMEELADRTVGRNELTTISVLRAFVEAQQRYASEARDGTAVRRFATRILSTPGKRDGLYWESAEGEEPSPFGPLQGDRVDAKRDAPYYGYRYRILTRQGASAPGGAYSYVINGNLVAGYAAVAWPEEYGRTGVMTFLVNHYGTVYEKDLGPDTGKLAAAMQAYAPDASWRESD